MKSIFSASDVNHACKKRGYKNWVQWLVSMRQPGLRPDWEHPKGTVYAIVSQGKWTVRCPGKDCFGEILVEEHAPLHFCPDCMNVENDFKPQRIIFPHVKDLHILFSKRPDYRLRNLEPGETAEDIRKQNEMMGWI